METFRDVDIVSSIYVDDLVSGSDDVQSTYEFYLKSKLRLATAGFMLRKFVTNSDELQRRIQEDETPDKAHKESYAKASLGVRCDEGPGVLGASCPRQTAICNLI